MAKSAAPSSRSAQAEKQPERSWNPPVFSVRHRALKATVWKNETENGAMFNTTLSRSYKDGDEWRESTSFGWDDLLIVAELLRTCYGFIAREMDKQGQQSRE
jgi:hypothetical protein